MDRSGTGVASGFAAVAVLFLLVAAPLAFGAGGDPGRKFGEADPGKGVALAQGTARNPRAIFLRVIGTAGPAISVTSVVECSRREKSKKVSRIRDGAYNTVAPSTRKLKLTVERPDRCRVSIVATYEQGSEDPIRAQLFARRPKR